jgi:hypothetical protein
MFEYEELTDIIGCSCTLLIPYRGRTEGFVVADYGEDIAMLQTKSILRQKASLHEKLQERRSRRFYLIQRGRSPFGEYNHQSIAI